MEEDSGERVYGLGTRGHAFLAWHVLGIGVHQSRDRLPFSLLGSLETTIVYWGYIRIMEENGDYYSTLGS